MSANPFGTDIKDTDILDDLGHPFPRPARPPKRIVSMAPNVTEILFALGLGDRVAGVTRFCDYPPEARRLPRIGGLDDPNIEIVRSLDPDLVIAFRGNPLRLVERIRKLGLPVFVLDIGEGLEDLPSLISKIGLITGTEARAEALAAGLRGRLGAVDAALKGIGARPKVFVLLYGQGLWTCGGESYVDDPSAGARRGQRRLGPGTGWKPVPPEELFGTAPHGPLAHPQIMKRMLGRAAPRRFGSRRLQPNGGGHRPPYNFELFRTGIKKGRGCGLPSPSDCTAVNEW